MPFEGIETRRPLGPIRLEPCVEFHQRLGAESVQPALRVPTHLDQTGVAEHLEVAGHAWLVHTDLVDELTDRVLAAADDVEYPLPCRLGDGLENRDVCWHGRNYTGLYIYAQPHLSLNYADVARRCRCAMVT